MRRAFLIALKLIEVNSFFSSINECIAGTNVKCTLVQPYFIWFSYMLLNKYECRETCMHQIKRFRFRTHTHSLARPVTTK